jgi:hypothetical protein
MSFLLRSSRFASRPWPFPLPLFSLTALSSSFAALCPPPTALCSFRDICLTCAVPINPFLVYNHIIYFYFFIFFFQLIADSNCY